MKDIEKNMLELTQKWINDLRQGPLSKCLKALNGIDKILSRCESYEEISDLGQGIFDALVAAIGSTSLNGQAGVNFMQSSCHVVAHLHRMEAFTHNIEVTDDHKNTLGNKVDELNGNDANTDTILQVFCRVLIPF